MNMKKTIAAIAAASVAVSAMATTVSALEAKTLTYNLVRTEKHANASGKITANFDSLTLTAGQIVRIATKGAGSQWVGDKTVSYEISGAYWDDVAGANKSFNRIFVSDDVEEEGWSKEGAALMTNGVLNTTSGGEFASNYVDIKVKVRTEGTNTSLVASKEANIKVVAKYKSLPAGVGSVKDLNGKINSGECGIFLAIYDPSGKADEVPLKVSVRAQGFTENDVKGATNAMAGTYTYTAAVDGGVTVDTADGATATGVYTGTEEGTFKYVQLPGGSCVWEKTDGSKHAVTDFDGVTFTGLKAEAPAVASSVTDLQRVAGDATVADVDVSGLDLDKLVAAGVITSIYDTGMITFENVEDSAFVTANGDEYMKVQWEGPIGAWDAGYVILKMSDIGVDVSGITTTATGDKFSIVLAGSTPAVAGTEITITKGTGATWTPKLPAGLTVGGTPVVGDKFTITAGKDAADEKGYVWSSTLSGSASDVTGATELKYPFKTTLNGTDNVLDNIYKLYDFSDVGNIKVANKENRVAITAVINDAIVNYSDVMFVFNTGVKPVVTNDSWSNAGPVGTYCENTWDAAGTLDVTQFGKHFWDEATGYDPNTIYISNDWLGNNLFSGALVINRNLTLSLGATDKFDWTGTSLSFSWDAIQDAALTTNGYANYITDMVLRTSADWYWDNFQVVLGATEDEEVGTTSPVEAEEEELEETEDEPEVEAEPEEEEEEEEEETETEPEPEVAPVAEKNPGTGNAPVALAVIPVALAAAAVVAKKRG